MQNITIFFYIKFHYPVWNLLTIFVIINALFRIIRFKLMNKQMDVWGSGEETRSILMKKQELVNSATLMKLVCPIYIKSGVIIWTIKMALHKMALILSDKCLLWILWNLITLSFVYKIPHFIDRKSRWFRNGCKYAEEHLWTTSLFPRFIWQAVKHMVLVLSF